MSKLSSALAVIPQGASLVEREPQVTAWIEEQTDAEQLRSARALLAAWRCQTERGSAERDAATRLDIRCERRLGQLPEAAPVKRPGTSGRRVRTSQSEGRALSRARALAAIPEEAFEEKLAEPKPSREKVLVAAIVPEPTVDPAADESGRVHRLVKGPAAGSWPAKFDSTMLNEKARSTIRETLESWRKWCDAWDATLAAPAGMRRVK